MPGRMTRKKSFGYIILILFLGAMIGSALGEVVGLVLPDGVVKKFFLNAVSGGLESATLNAVLFTITIGFTIKLNVIGVVGIVIAAYLLKWY